MPKYDHSREFVCFRLCDFLIFRVSCIIRWHLLRKPRAFCLVLCFIDYTDKEWKLMGISISSPQCMKRLSNYLNYRDITFSSIPILMTPFSDCLKQLRLFPLFRFSQSHMHTRPLCTKHMVSDCGCYGITVHYRPFAVSIEKPIYLNATVLWRNWCGCKSWLCIYANCMFKKWNRKIFPV